ncbi:MAG: hypothetical protein R3265_15910 [Hyphomonas sp.]|nr:hypothetical protein [Hyphomonas sp.]
MILEVDDFVGTIRIVQSDTGDLEIVSIDEGAADLGGVVLDDSDPGHIKLRGAPAPLAMNCARTNGSLSVAFGDGRTHPLSDFPSIVISAPDTADVKLSLRAGDAEISDVGNLEILAGGCSKVVAGDIADTLRLTTTGSARLDFASADRADIDANNGGRIHITNVRKLLNACLGRTSRLTSDTVSGSAEVYQSGASRTELKRVELNELVAELDGTAALQVGGTAAQSRMTVAGTARANITQGITLGAVDLQRAGRLVIDGERWKGPNHD